MSPQIGCEATCQATRNSVLRSRVPSVAGLLTLGGELIAQRLSFVEGKPGFLDKVKASSGVSLTARRCDGCDNLQIFGKSPGG